MNRYFFYSLFAFIALSVTVTAQPEYQQFVLQEESVTLSFRVLEEAHVRPKNDRFYYWIKSRQFHKTKGGYQGRLLDGEYVKYAKDQRLLEQGSFKKGLKHGEWKSWHLNGELASITQWRHGLPRGTWYYFDEQGNILKTERQNGVGSDRKRGASPRRIRKGEETTTDEEEEGTPPGEDGSTNKKVRRPFWKRKKPTPQ